MKKIFKISIIAIMTFAIIVPIHPILSTVTKPKVTATDSLVIIHPHSADFAAHVISAFQKWYLAETGNSIIVTTIEKDSGAALAEVLAWNGVSPLADIYWGGGEFNFEQARLAGLLVRYNVTEDGNITRFLSGWHLKDDSDLNLDPSWYGAAISGFGIMYNKEVLEAEGLPIPTTWDDLTKHEYFGQITMANPDFSGSTTATVKMILMEKITKQMS